MDVCTAFSTYTQEIITLMILVKSSVNQEQTIFISRILADKCQIPHEVKKMNKNNRIKMNRSSESNRLRATNIFFYLFFLPPVNLGCGNQKQVSMYIHPRFVTCLLCEGANQKVVTHQTKL